MEISALFRHARDTQSFGAGDRIFDVGDPGTCMYVVRSGEVEVRAGETVVEVLGPGGLFGELALIDDAPRSASARARSACELVPVDAERFRTLVQELPSFALEVMGLMARRLRRQTRAS
jgi:CRP/FNR family cyclic AMP-dependent transcriptional regulator